MTAGVDGAGDALCRRERLKFSRRRKGGGDPNAALGGEPTKP